MLVVILIEVCYVECGGGVEMCVNVSGVVVLMMVFYVVVCGDSLFLIVASYGVLIDDFVEVNVFGF